VYAVSSKKSSLDFGTYMQVMRASHIPVNNIDPAEVGLVRVDGAVTCAERALLVDAPRAFFMEELKDALKLNCRVRKIEQAQLAYEASPRVRVDEKEYDWCINCTHNQNFVMTDLDVFYEPCLLLIYRDKRPEELRKRLMAITIMDGPLPSLYPYVLDLESFQANVSSLCASDNALAPISSSRRASPGTPMRPSSPRSDSTPSRTCATRRWASSTHSPRPRRS
jgi:hypothetical protein